MAKPQLLQGSLEEFLSHTELKNRRDLMLIVPVSSEPLEEEPPLNLAEAMKDYVGSFNFGDANLSENSSEKFATLLHDKYQEEITA